MTNDEYATVVVATTWQREHKRTGLKLTMLAIFKALTSTGTSQDRQAFISSGPWSSSKWHLQKGN